MFLKTTDCLVIFALLLTLAALGYVTFEVRHYLHTGIDSESSADSENEIPTETLRTTEDEELVDRKTSLPPGTDHRLEESTSIVAFDLSTDLGEKSTEAPAQSNLGLSVFAGSILDAFGNPVQFADVHLDSPTVNSRRKTRTNQYGRFRFEDLKPAGDYQLTVESEPRFETFNAYELALEDPVTDWVATLEYASQTSLSGSVVDQLGNPVSRLRLQVVSEEWSGNTTVVVSDTSGNYELTNFIPGRINIRSIAPPNIMVHGLALKPDDLSHRELVVDIGHQHLFGMVNRIDGVPVSAVDINMRFEQSHDEGYRVTTVRSGTTDDDGEFRFTGLGSGARTLTFSAAGFNRHVIELDPSLDPGPHSIILSSGELPSPD